MAQRALARPDGVGCKLDPVTPPELELERERCERARAGDRDALAALLREHGPRLYRSVLLPRLGSAAAAEEALAQTYMKVIERIAQFSWQNVGFYPWLRIVGLHVAVDQLRRRRREFLFEPADLLREIDGGMEVDSTPDALEDYDRRQSRRQVETLLDSIPARYALAIRLRILEERSRESAALELGVSVATFDVVLHRAMAALKKALAARSELTP
ncbi:MAG TPA: sigma-70 family RNA polymerase sigma factor [Polyangiaceae bacterium]